MNISLSPVSFAAVGRPKKVFRTLIPLSEFDGPFLQLTPEEEKTVSDLIKKRASLDPSDRKGCNQINEIIRAIKRSRYSIQKESLK